VSTGTRVADSDRLRGLPLVAPMQELQASKCENQWHPQVQITVETQALEHPTIAFAFFCAAVPGEAPKSSVVPADLSTNTCAFNPSINTFRSIRSTPPAPYLQRFDGVYGSTGKRSEHPRGMPLVARLLDSSEQAWEPMASSSVNVCRKRAPYTAFHDDPMVLTLTQQNPW
jgi:hypothetical protein